MKKMSFCITCKNRFDQISKVLRANLKGSLDLKDMIEFVLVDFNSTDGLQEWILSEFKQELDEGYLKYFYTDKLPNWNASIAKNTAHYCARGEFLINLDCDNYIGDGGGEFVYKQFLKYGTKLLLHQFSGNFRDGTYGRIGMHRKYFIAIGGYNEAFQPMGFQDGDLIDRLCEFGLSYKRICDAKYVFAIGNTKEEGLKYCGSSFSYMEMEFANVKLSRSNLYNGQLVANTGIFGLREDFLFYKDGQMRLYPGVLWSSEVSKSRH